MNEPGNIGQTVAFAQHSAREGLVAQIKFKHHRMLHVRQLQNFARLFFFPPVDFGA
jgi:hypothetical protein